VAILELVTSAIAIVSDGFMGVLHGLAFIHWVVFHH
jgi:hypothetical protein